MKLTWFTSKEELWCCICCSQNKLMGFHWTSGALTWTHVTIKNPKIVCGGLFDCIEAQISGVVWLYLEKCCLFEKRWSWILQIQKVSRYFLVKLTVQVGNFLPFEPPHDKTNKMACAPSEDLDQPAVHPPSLIRVFAVHMKKAWVLSYPVSAQQRHWSDWADAQADLSLHWAHMPFCWCCHEAPHFLDSLS